MAIHKGKSQLTESRAGAELPRDLDVNTSPFEQEMDFVRQSFRFDKPGLATEFGNSGSVFPLALFDDDARGMILVGKFDGRVRNRTSAGIGLAELVSDPRDISAKLCIGIAGMSAHGFFETGSAIGSQRAQIFCDQ